METQESTTKTSRQDMMLISLQSSLKKNKYDF